MTEDQLYELDRYELIDEFQNAFDVTISENFTRNTDLSIDTWNTADGYEVFVISDGDYTANLSFEHDVYYYQPSCAEILQRIVECANGYDAKVYCADIEMYFDDEQAIVECLIDNFPDRYEDNEDE